MNDSPFKIIGKVNIMIQGKMSEEAANAAGRMFLHYCGIALLILATGIALAVCVLAWK